MLKNGAAKGHLGQPSMGTVEHLSTNCILLFTLMLLSSSVKIKMSGVRY